LFLFGFSCVYLDAKPNRRQRALSLSDFGAEPDNCVDCRLGLVQLRRVAAGLKDEGRLTGAGERASMVRICFSVPY
jgi:hypothetical protein